MFQVVDDDGDDDDDDDDDEQISTVHWEIDFFLYISNHHFHLMLPFDGPAAHPSSLQNMGSKSAWKSPCPSIN